METEREWREHILSEIRLLREANDKQLEVIRQLSTSLAEVQVKSSIFGIIGGMIPLFIGLVMLWIEKQL